MKDRRAPRKLIGVGVPRGLKVRGRAPDRRGRVDARYGRGGAAPEACAPLTGDSLCALEAWGPARADAGESAVSAKAGCRASAPHAKTPFVGSGACAGHGNDRGNMARAQDPVRGAARAIEHLLPG